MKDRCQVFRNRPNAARLSTKRIRALAYLTHAHTHALAYTLMHTHSHTLAQVYARTLTHILKADFEKKTFLRPTASGKGRGGEQLLKQIQSRAVSQPPVGAKIGENQNRKKNQFRETF